MLYLQPSADISDALKALFVRCGGSLADLLESKPTPSKPQMARTPIAAKLSGEFEKDESHPISKSDICLTPRSARLELMRSPVSAAPIPRFQGFDASPEADQAPATVEVPPQAAPKPAVPAVPVFEPVPAPQVVNSECQTDPEVEGILKKFDGCSLSEAQAQLAENPQKEPASSPGPDFQSLPPVPVFSEPVPVKQEEEVQVESYIHGDSVASLGSEPIQSTVEAMVATDPVGGEREDDDAAHVIQESMDISLLEEPSDELERLYAERGTTCVEEPPVDAKPIISDLESTAPVAVKKETFVPVKSEWKASDAVKMLKPEVIDLTKAEDDDTSSPDRGTTVQLAQVHGISSARPPVASPVRRSLRHTPRKQTAEERQQVLENTDFAYAPNPYIGEAKPRVRWVLHRNWR